MRKSDLKMLAAARRKDALVDLRDGRRFRSTRIESAKRYERNTKHKHKRYDTE